MCNRNGWNSSDEIIASSQCDQRRLPGRGDVYTEAWVWVILARQRENESNTPRPTEWHENTHRFRKACLFSELRIHQYD